VRRAQSVRKGRRVQTEPPARPVLKVPQVHRVRRESWPGWPQGPAGPVVPGVVVCSSSPSVAGYTSTGLTFPLPGVVWTTLAPMPTARHGLAAAAGSDGKIYAIGGTISSGAAVATMEAYDPVADTWSAAAPMSAARTGLARRWDRTARSTPSGILQRAESGLGRSV